MRDMDEVIKWCVMTIAIAAGFITLVINVNGCSVKGMQIKADCFKTAPQAYFCEHITL